MLALDTETALSSDLEPVPELVCVSVAGEGGTKLYHAGDDWRPVVAEAFCTGVILANAPFDVYVLLRAEPGLLPLVVDAYANDRVFDVLTREKYIDIAEGMHRKRGKYGLGPVAKRRAGIELDKNDPWRKRYAELLHVPIAQWPAEAVKYARDDATATWHTWVAQEQFRQAHDVDVFADASRRARKHLALYEQTLRGMYTDAQRVAALDKRLMTEITTHMIACLEAGVARVGKAKGKPAIVRNRKATEAALVAEFGDATPRTPPTAKRPNGTVRLDKNTLASLTLPEGHVLDHARQLGAKQSVHTKQVVPMREPWIRTRFDELMGSGRTSSSKPGSGWTGTNLQNLPKKGGFRECLMPPPGHVFVRSDYSAAELVTLAQVQIDLFGRSALADMLRAGINPHTQFGCRMLGIGYDEYDKRIPAHKDARQSAKAFNFGKPGGMGQKRFIAYALTDYGVTLTPDQERVYDRDWHAQFPEMREFFDYVQGLAGPDGLITVMQPRSGRIRGGLRFPDACNTHFQGLAADAAGLALWWLWLAGLDPHSPLHTAGPVVSANGHVPVAGQALFVHDENVRVCRIADAEAVKAEQERIMIAAFGVFCPDVPIEVESHIEERYYEAAA